MRKWVLLAGFVLALSPASARADWLFTPHVGSTFGEGGFTYGASIGWMGAGKFGWETEFAWTPGFLDLERTDDPEFDDECQKLVQIMHVWNAQVLEPVPVIYAVTITDDAFSDADFPGLVSKCRSSFSFQLEKWGKVESKPGDFWARKSVCSSSIVAKVVLTQDEIETL